MEFWDLARREAERDRHRENAGRLAVVQQQYSTVGQGVVEMDERLDFGLTFIEKPWPSTGFFMDPDDVREVLALEPDAAIPVMPQCTLYVTEWDQDEKQNYIGCWVAIAVLFPTGIPVDAQLKISHYITLQAVALKNVPMEVEE